MMTFKDLKKNLRKDFSGLKKLKLAVLGDSATQLVVQALRGYGFERGYDFDVFESDYDQVNRQIADASSELYAASPDVVIVLQSSEKLLEKFYKLPLAQQKVFAEDVMAKIKSMLASLAQNSKKSRIIIANFPEIDDAVFGNYANKHDASFVYVVRKLNLLLMDVARENSALSILDIASIQNIYGRKVTYDPRLHIDASMVYSLDALPVLAKNMVDIIAAGQGVFKKCLILDLDHTLWGGVIGDDGLEKIEIGDLGIGKAYTALQLWIKQLQMRGVLLVVCSKNTESVAKEPFEKHEDMVLTLDDISVFVANWNNKADNIRYIQSVMNIGFDSMVFVDDNVFERNMVRASLPEVTVPEMPEDPVDYLGFLQCLNLFESGTLTEQDFERTRMIQANVKAQEMQSNFANEDEFLQSLSMVGAIAAFDAFNTPRVAQLSQRSNQYNLRTVRYTEDDIAHIAQSPQYVGLALSLKDNLSDHGLISALIMEQQGDDLFIESWFMSCRVLKRGVECMALNAVVAIAKKRGAKRVLGEYLPTPKNALVKDHYANLGFEKSGDTKWVLNVNAFNDLKTHIKTELKA